MTYAECMYEACMMHAHDAFTHEIIRELQREISVHRDFKSK
jgi:hypothetical protein